MKPRIICHIMASVDGRLLPERWTPPFDGKTMGEVCQSYQSISRQLGTGAWMFGKNTLQESFFPQTFCHEGLPKAGNTVPFHGARPSERMFIVADPLGEILYTANTVRGDGIITILGEDVSEDYLAHLKEMGISFLFAGKDGKDLGLAMESLYHDFCIDSISLQGGAIINGAFLKAGLIDELSLLIYPGIDGLTGIPSIFEYAGKQNEIPAKGQSLELVDVATLDNGVVSLRYRFHKETPINNI